MADDTIVISQEEHEKLLEVPLRLWSVKKCLKSNEFDRLATRESRRIKGTFMAYSEKRLFRGINMSGHRRCEYYIDKWDYRDFILILY